MAERVAVVGAGLAGLAAAAAALARGAEVRLFDASVGASALGGGAVDDQSWELVADAAALLGEAPLARTLEPALEPFLAALDLWSLPAPGEPLCRLATEAGRIRIARGRDRALLDLAILPVGVRVVVPRVPRLDWDADWLSRALGEQPYARARRLRFDPVEGDLLRFIAEQEMDAAALAGCLDAPARLDWLGETLAAIVERERRCGHDVGAVLLGPWLGLGAPRAGALAERLRLPVGELLCTLASAAGYRFEAARDRLLARLGIEREPRSVRRVRPAPGGHLLDVEGVAEPVEAAAVVLATGGLVGGGIRYRPPEIDAEPDEPAGARPAFALSCQAPVALRAAGEPLEIVSSLAGPTLDDLAWPTGAAPGLLERVGIACDGVRARERLYVAGDARADRPRTKLEAVRSGLAAGVAAAGEPRGGR